MKKLFVVILSVLFLSSGSGFAQSKIKFPVAISTKSLGYGAMYAAVQQGFFDREGLEGQLVAMRAADKAFSALVSGSVYVAASGPDAHLSLVERGVDLVIIGGTIQGLSHVIMGGKNYKNYSDLRGTTIGVTTVNSGAGVALKRVLKAKGLEFGRDYQLIATGGGGPTLAALTSGQVSAAMIGVPLNFPAAEQGFNTIGRVVDVLPNYQFAVFSVYRAMAEKNRSLLVRFMKAMVSAHRWIHDNKEPAIDFLTKEMKLKPDYARKGWEYYVENRLWPTDGDVSMDGLGVATQIFWEATQAKGPIPNPQKLVDQSYFKQAMKELAAR